MCCNCHHDTPNDHQPHCCGCHAGPVELTEAEANLLRQFAQIPFLPLARFLMVNQEEDDLESVGLAPVFLSDGKETVAQIKEVGNLLLDLEEKGLITLDYDIPLSGYDYEIYRTSDAYLLFVDTVLEGSQREGFLFDTPILELGSMALTAAGRSAVEQLDHL